MVLAQRKGRLGLHHRQRSTRTLEPHDFRALYTGLIVVLRQGRSMYESSWSYRGYFVAWYVCYADKLTLSDPSYGSVDVRFWFQQVSHVGEQCYSLAKCRLNLWMTCSIKTTDASLIDESIPMPGLGPD